MQGHLAANGLENVDPHVWYPLQQWLDVFNDISAEGNRMYMFVSIGMKIVETAVLPPEFDDLPFKKIIEMIDYAYKMNNRGTDIGAYIGEVINERHIKVTITAPYPDDYNYGILYGFARRYLAGEQFTVAYDENVLRCDMDGDETVINVTW